MDYTQLKATVTNEPTFEKKKALYYIQQMEVQMYALELKRAFQMEI